MNSTENKCDINLDQLDENIRPFPATAARIVSLCNSSTARTSDITELIECEPAVAIKMLSVANSPMYAATREITAINHAIVVLGFRTVTQLALSVATGPLFSAGNEALSGQRERLFYESLGVATVSRILADEFELADPSEAFLSGMMLDVGKLFFFDVAPDSYLTILEQNQSGNTVEAEQETFRIDHTTVGSTCGQKWGLPRQINAAIKDHHLNFDEVDDELTRCVIIGSYFAKKWDIGFNQVDLENCPVMESKFSDDISDELIEKTKVQYSAFKTMFT